jgi:hypothetical protein
MYAYYVSKANTTPQVNVDMQPFFGLVSEYILAVSAPTRWLSSVSLSRTIFF